MTYLSRCNLLNGDAMNLREKTLIIISITLVSLIIILYGISQTIIMGSFTELEEDLTRQNVKRVLNTLSDDLVNLDCTVNDWAAWDDTYTFIEDSNADYIESNLIDSTFVTLRLNIMIFVHSSGSIVLKKAVDLQEEMEMPFPQSLEQHISVNDFLVQHDSTESSLAGFLLLPEGPLMVASRPILTSNDEGPIRGTLMMGRYFDAAEIERLQEITQLSLIVQGIDSQMPSDFEAVLTFVQEESIFVQPLSEDSIAGYYLVSDVYGEPILLLRVDTPRDIYHQGRTSMQYFVISLVATGLVIGVVILVLLESQVLSRLTHLSRSVSSISAQDDLSARISLTGKDELSNLADVINQMIETIEQSSKKLQYSLREKEVLLREIHHRVKNNMQIILSLLSLQSAYIKDEKLQDAFRESRDRIQTMALIHEKLYQSEDLANINFKEYIRTLANGLFQSYGALSDKVKLKIDVGDISLGINTAIPCGLIINELVSNALKHAFPDGREGEIRIAFHARGERTELVVSDNGVGIPDDVGFINAGTLGLRLVTILAEDQLNGKVTLNRHKGTEFKITFGNHGRVE